MSNIHIDPVVQQQLAQHGITEKTGVFGDHKIQIGKSSPIRLDKIKGNSIPYQGIRTATKISRGKEGLSSSINKTLDVLKSPGTLKASELLAALKTNTEYTERLTKLEQLSEAQQKDSLWAFAPHVERLSNADLAAIYQVFTSGEMDLLQTALQREGNINTKANDARAAASQLFDLQALVLKEMSNRVSNGRLDELIAKDPEHVNDYNALRPLSLSRQYAKQEIIRPSHVNDISASNLHILANVAAQSATQREKTAAAETQKLASRGMSATPREMGDVLRQSPLTINLPTRRLLRDNSFVLTPDNPMPTVFHMQNQHILNKGASYMLQRDETEKLVFPEFEGHDAVADERPVYGALNTQNNQSGPAATSYGSCVIVLKPEVARRSTFIAEDTFFSPALTITPERKTNFYALLDGSGLPPEVTETLRNNESNEHKILEKWFDMGAKSDDLTAGFLKAPPSEILSLLPPGDEGRELFSTVCLQAFGDKTATRSKIASYDNIESLLPDMTDLNGAMLAHAAERRAQGLDSSVRLALNYIEAQIQGPVIPSRDFEEIRVNLDEGLSPEERLQLIARMEAFNKATGVKIVYVSDEITPAELPADSTATLESDMSAKDSQRAYDLQNAGTRYFAEHIRQEAETALASELEHIQDYLHSMAQDPIYGQRFPADGDVFRGSMLSQLKRTMQNRFNAFFANPSITGGAHSAKEIAQEIIKDSIRPVLAKKAELLQKLETLPLAGTQKQRLTDWICSSTANTATELEKAHTNMLLEDTLGEEMNNIQDYMRDMVQNLGLTELFPAEGEILRGSILNRINRAVHEKFSAFLENPTPLTAEFTPKHAAAQVINDAIRPYIENKASLLRKLDTLAMIPPQKEKFAYWVRSSLVRSPDELQLAYDNAAIQAQALYTIAKSGNSMSLQDIFTILKDAAIETGRLASRYEESLQGTDKEYGADDKNKDLERGITLAYPLLTNAKVPLTADEIKVVYDRLNTPEMRGMLGQFAEVAGSSAIVNNKDVDDYGTLNTVRLMLALHLMNSAREIGVQHSEPTYIAENSLIPEQNRELFRSVAPHSMALFDAAHPAYASFPAPANPDAMPKTDAERRAFLTSQLDRYIAHEQSFDKGTSTHGRGHVARAYIFASAMCSILEEQGVSVDRNAVLCGITCHDVGRKGGGTDIWEEDSANLTVEAMRASFGADSMGEEYEKALRDDTTKNSSTVEGMVFKAADSLDIGRTRELDLDRMPFLHGKNGERIGMEARKLREQLGKEADLLQRLTNPLCMDRNLLQKLDMEAGANPLLAEDYIAQKHDKLEEIARKFEQEWVLSAEDFMSKIEDTVRNNPDLFPVLSKYYH